MTTCMTESDVEDAALGWFGELGYAVVHGPNIRSGAVQTKWGAGYGGVCSDGLLPKVLSGEPRVKEAFERTG